MPDTEKTKAQLEEELRTLQTRYAELEDKYRQKDRFLTFSQTADVTSSLAGTGNKRSGSLCRNEDINRILVNNAREIILVTRDDRIEFHNPRATEVLGYSSEELTAGSFAKLIHPEDREALLNRYRDTPDGRAAAETNTLRILGRNGNIRIIDVSVVRMEWDGKPATLNFLTDITERKRAEDALCDSESRYRTVISTTLEGIWIVDMNGRIIDVNESYCTLIGYRRDEIIGRHISVFEAVESTIDDVAAHQEKIRKHRVDLFETHHRKKTGEIVDLEIATTYYDSEGGQIYAFMRDITERKRTESSLRESEEKYRLIVENQTDLVVKSDREGRFLYGSPSVCALFGKREDELFGTTCLPLVHEDDRPIVNEAITSLLRPPYTVNFEVRMHAVQGWKWLGWGFKAQFDEKGKVAAFVGSARDITLRKNAELALSEQEKYLRTILQTAVEGFWVVDSTRKIIDSNETYCRMLGYTRDELLLLQISDIEAQEDPAEIAAHGERMRRNGSDLFETRFRRKDGSFFDVEVSVTCIWDAEGIKYVCFCRNITERKQSLLEIQWNEARLRSLVDIFQHKAGTVQELYDFALDKAVELTRSKLGYLFFYSEDTREFTLYTWNKAALEQCGISNPPQQYILDNTGIWGEAVRQRKPIILNNFSGFHPLKKGYPEEHSHLSRFLTIPVFHEGRIHAVVGVANKETDYTDLDVLQLTLLMDGVWKRIEQTKTEELLRESESFLNELLHAIPIPVFYKDRDFKYLGLNKAFEEFLGVEEKKVNGKTVFDICPPELAAIYHTQDSDLLRKGGVQRYESQIKNPRGEFKDVIFNKAIFTNRQGEVSGLIGTILDITDHKRMERALRESEQRYREVFESTHDGIFIVGVEPGPKFRYLDFNPAAEHFIGLAASDLSGKYITEVIGDDLSHIITANYHQCIERNEAVSYEEKLHLPSGETYFFTTLIPIKDSTGAIYRILTVSHDITRSKCAEEALRTSEARYRKIIETTHDGVALVSPQGEFLEVNDAYCDMVGYSREELLAMSIPDVEVIEDRLAFESHQKIIAKQGFHRFETRHFHKNGKIIEVEASIAHLTVEDIYVSFFRDITDRHRLEQQLLQAQKMETIGRLAGGVAHDFNNILTVINANAELALMFMQPSDRHFEAFEEIHKAGNRAANLTRQLLAFSRKQIIEPKVINLNQTLLEMNKMFRRLIGEHIELAIIQDESLSAVKIDPGQIEQVLSNLVVNARDAMPDGGKLTIETRNVFLDEEFSQHHPDIVSGKYVLLLVKDTGQGMSEEVIRHVFEPFYTTKPVGAGTGLGLSTCYGIVKQNNGEIEILSKPGCGATVKVYLPDFEGESAVFSPGSGRRDIPIGTETILVAEDDVSIRGIIHHLLTTAGYRVLTAANGHEALSLAQKYKESIDLLITDVIMPLMGGRELAEKLKEIRPNLPVLYISGYTDQPITPPGVRDEGVAFLQKPFSTITFAQKVRELLDK